MSQRIDRAVADEAIRQSDILNYKTVTSRNTWGKCCFYKKLLSKGCTEQGHSVGFDPTQIIGRYSSRILEGDEQFGAKSALLRMCVLWDLPITFDDIKFIKNHMRFLRMITDDNVYIIAEYDKSMDMVYRFGLYAAVPAFEEWGSPEPVNPSNGFFVRKHGRMSAKVSEAAPKKSKQGLISEAKAATLMYYSGMAREAQQTYMRKFNTLTEQ